MRYGDNAPADKRQDQRTANGYTVLDRKRVFIPPVQRNNAAVTYYSAIGTLVELAVHEASGKVELLSHHSIMECGNQIAPQLVSGQLQGGLAMGIGHALHEYLPLYEDGPGNGTWNFNRYRLPRASDVAVWKQTGEVLPPLSETDPPKGIAEVVMIPIVGGHRQRRSRMRSAIASPICRSRRKIFRRCSHDGHPIRRAHRIAHALDDDQRQEGRPDRTCPTG